MMQVGSFVFSLLKKNQQKNRTFKTDEIVFFTKEDRNIKCFSAVILYSKFENFKINPNINYEIIFDTDSFSNKEIIDYMVKNRSKNVIFKNFLSDSNYIIGSNHSNDIGEVLFLSNFE